MFGFDMISIEERLNATAIQAAQDRERKMLEDPEGVRAREIDDDRARLEYIQKVRTGQTAALHKLERERYHG